MLIFSYVIAAALEATLTYQLYVVEGVIPWIYLMLLCSSLLSIPIECSEAGETMRKTMKEAGKNIDQYDIFSNWGRCFVYLAVWAGYLPADTGAILACACIGIAMLVATIRVNKK